jgi:hypothetical protein
MIKRKTAVDTAKQRAKRNKELILAITELDEQEIFVLMVDTASDYLEKQLGPDEQGRKLLLSASAFWAWWRNHWNRIDSQFIDDVVNHSTDNTDDLKAYYKHLHSSGRMQRIRPHKTIMNQSFANATEKEVMK